MSVDRSAGRHRLSGLVASPTEIQGGTLVVDCVRYKTIGGRFANWLIIENDLRRIFEYRRRRMLE